MALSRVQATGRVTASAVGSVALSFATAPTVGNGIVVTVIAYTNTAAPAGGCTDNRGNIFVQAITRKQGFLNASIYFLPILLPSASAAPYQITITVDGFSTYFESAAVEVGGVGLGLTMDQVVGATAASGTAISTGTSAAVAGAEIFVAAACAIGANQASITAEVLSPAWVQEFENLNYSSTIAGEGDTRIRSSAAGTTQVGNWTAATTAASASVLVAFVASATPTITPVRVSQVPIEILHGTAAAIGVRLSQLPIEILHGTVYVPPVVDLRVSHVLADVLSLAAVPVLRVSSVLIDVLLGPVPPIEQTFEDGGVSHPLTWITLTKKDGSKHPYSEVDLNDPPSYYDGYKRPRVERFLTIARGLSDRDGQIEHMAFGAVLSDIATDRFDIDREFRATLADAVNQYLTNRPLEVWFVDDVERRRLGLPRLAAVGFVNDYAPTADLQFELKGADWLKKKFSRKRRAQQGWQPLITAADFPACPEETLNSPAPLIYGSLGIGGSDAVVGVTITVGPQPVAAPANFDLSLVAGGKTAGVTRYYTVSAFVAGVESDQTPVLVERTTNTQKTIRVNWDAVSGAEFYRVYSSHRSDFLQGALLDVSSSVTQYDDVTVLPNENREWITGTNWLLMLRQNFQYLVYAKVGGGLFSIPGTAYTVITPIADRREVPSTRIQRNITVSWTAHPGAVDGYRIIRRRSYYSDWDAEYNRQWDVAAGVLSVTDDNVVTTPVTMPTGELIATSAAGQAEATFVGIGAYGSPTPITVSALLIARHACARVGNIYIPNTTDAAEGETSTTYLAVPDSAFGVTWFAPDHPGWIYPTKYVEINGQRFTLIFTTIEPLPDRVFVDVDGIETAADGTGTLIRSIVDQRLHFMVNFIAPDTPWATGPYLTAASTVFPHLPDIPLVDEVSHAAVKASLATRLSGTDYEGATIIGAAREFVSALDALARFQQSGDFDQTFNRKGQDTVSCEPIEAALDLPVIGDVLSIRQGSFNLIDQVQSAFFNIIPYVHSRDYTGREKSGWKGNAEIRSDESITNYDQEREAPKMELHACRANTPQGSATIADVMARKLARFQDPRRIGSLQMPFEGLNYEPGSVVAITHLEGIGAEGWTGREVRIIRHEVEPTTGLIRLDFYDLTAVLENHEALRRRRAALNSDGRPR
jgi:hypothetical protein